MKFLITETQKKHNASYTLMNIICDYITTYDESTKLNEISQQLENGITSPQNYIYLLKWYKKIILAYGPDEIPNIAY